MLPNPRPRAKRKLPVFLKLRGLGWYLLSNWLPVPDLGPGYRFSGLGVLTPCDTAKD